MRTLVLSTVTSRHNGGGAWHTAFAINSLVNSAASPLA
jgi:hypothetical protein